MPMFQEHPDGLVYVRTDAGTYGDTRANFELDHGQPIPPMPEGATAHIYDQGVRHLYQDTGGNMVQGFPANEAWDFGDDAIAAIDELLRKQNVRKDLSQDTLDMGTTTRSVVTSQ